MFRALLWKELRACWPFALAAFAVQSLLAAQRVESAPLEPVQVLEDREIVMLLRFVSLILGIVLGLWQTLPESAMGTAAFAAQTARSRWRIVTAKIAAALLLFTAALFVPLFVAVALIVRRSDWIIPLSWSDARHLWAILAAGATAYLGTLALGLRGLPWREGLRQIAGAVAVFTGVALGLASPFFGWALAILGATASLSAAWAYSGFEAREF